MGCDIHSVIQGQWLTKDSKGDEILADDADSSCWHTVAEGFHDRHYELFGLLAGVRSTINAALFEPRGLPKNFMVHDDLHPIPIDFQFDLDGFRRPTEYEPWIFDMGEHSHTWFSLPELVEAEVRAKDEVATEIRRMIVRIRRCHASWPNHKNWRLVMGFDS